MSIYMDCVVHNWSTRVLDSIPVISHNCIKSVKLCSYIITVGIQPTCARYKSLCIIFCWVTNRTSCTVILSVTLLSILYIELNTSQNCVWFEIIANQNVYLVIIYQPYSLVIKDIDRIRNILTGKSSKHLNQTNFW